MKIPYCFTAALVWIALGAVLLAGLTRAEAQAWSGTQIRKLGLEARLDGARRDAILLQLAGALRTLPKARVHERQGDFQYALLLQCDPAIYATLPLETIEGSGLGIGGAV